MATVAEDAIGLLIDHVSEEHGAEVATGFALSLLNLDAIFPGTAAELAGHLGDEEPGPSPVIESLPSSDYRRLMHGRDLSAADQLEVVKAYFGLRAESPDLSLADFMGLFLGAPDPPPAPPAAAPSAAPKRELRFDVSTPRAWFATAHRAAEARSEAGDYDDIRTPADGLLFALSPDRQLRLHIVSAEGGPYCDVYLWDPAAARIVAEHPPAYQLAGSYRLEDDDAVYIVNMTLHDREEG